jgi:cation transport protein ChaC
MWRPGFRYVEQHRAQLHGYHRSLCIFSHVHRGTPDAPGLVLGLDRGGACRGLAFRVPGPEAGTVLDYLDARENIGDEIVYARRLLPVRLLDSGRTVCAIAYVVDRATAHYCRPAAEEAARAIARGIGKAGPNRDYLLNTLSHLRAMGVRDAGLDRIAALLPPGPEAVQPPREVD